MNRKSHYLKLFLSVLVLILPSLLVAWLGWKNIGYARDKQKADATKIAAAAQDSERREIGKLVWNRLDGIMSLGIGDGGDFVDPAVKFVVWVDGERIALPWEKDPNAQLYSQTINDPAFVFERNRAERAEQVRPLDTAIELYREMIQSAATGGQQLYA